MSKFATMAKDISFHITDIFINSVKAGATEVRVEVCSSVDSFEFRISDNGCGIEDIALARTPMYTTGNPDERCGMGFLVMESFTDYLHVKSKLGRGTTILMGKYFKP